MQKTWVKHLWFWIPYLILEGYTESYWMYVQYQQPYGSTLYHAFLEEFLQIVFIKAPMVYLMLYFIERFAHKSKQYILLFLLLTGSAVLFSWLGYVFLLKIIVPYIYPHLEITGLGGFGTMVNSFMDKIFIACVAVALNEYFYNQNLKKRETQLLKEKTETELNFLRSQINPHFLFNTLNNIYALARKKADETPDVILKLSKLLRFVLYETEPKFILISREVEFLNDYIDLQKIRFDDRLEINFTAEVDNWESPIMPLSLIPFVENAFKHGASQSTQDAFIHIFLSVKNKRLRMEVSNSVEGNNESNPEGIGLKNLKRQLELCYRDFELKSENSVNVYKSTLVLSLSELL